AVCRYRDELLLPEPGLVVLRNAHSVLPTLSAAFLGGAKTRTMEFPAGGVRRRIPDALPDAGRLSAERHVGAGRLCGLPAARICPGHDAGNVAQPIHRA